MIFLMIFLMILINI